MFFLDILKKESPLPLRWCRALTITIFFCALFTFFMILITKLVDEVPTMKVTYENEESIPAPSKINDCQIWRGYNYGNQSSTENCMEYFNQELLLSDNVRKRIEQIAPLDLDNCTGLLHNGNISLTERDMIVLNLTLDSTMLNILLLFDSEYLTYSDQPSFVDSLNLENTYLMSHYSNATMCFFNRFKRQLMDTTMLTQIGFSPNYKSYHYINIAYQSFFQGTSNNTYSIMKVKPKSTVLQVEIEQKSRTIIDILGTITALYSLMMSLYIFLFQRELNNEPYGLIKRFVVFGGSPEKSLKERFTNPIEKSLIERIEYLESQIKIVKYEDVKPINFNTYTYF
ncbi:hypothetical protein F8M41_025317 [Gigaspora margarita]|uniref:Uncharacterized protein n=1 Tax=Gigaspora margarita TaxID=4874 RepID=A0A8H4B4Y9_GIGMA|nr:hypothetical protein F8M41_025317 [Gigaspora margarita]